jgi:hypothetical protein
MNRLVQTTFVLALLSASPALAAGPNCDYPIRNDSRDGYVCVGRWVQGYTGRNIRCDDGTMGRQMTYRCTQWQLTGGGRLVDPNRPNPRIVDPNRRDPRSTRDGRNRVDPPPAPPLR